MSEWETYYEHLSTPLDIKIMPKSQPLRHIEHALLYCGSWWQPPNPNYIQLNVSLFHTLGVFVFSGELYVLELQRRMDVFLGDFARVGRLVKRQVCSCPSIGIVGPHVHKSSSQQCNLLGHYPPWNLWGSHSRYHFLAWKHWYFPRKSFGMCILGLHIAASYCGYLAIRVVIDMACHCSPLTKALHMIKHAPRIFHIAPNLHYLHKVNASSREIKWHLETKTFSFEWPRNLFSWKNLKP